MREWGREQFIYPTEQQGDRCVELLNISALKRILNNARCSKYDNYAKVCNKNILKHFFQFMIAEIIRHRSSIYLSGACDNYWSYTGIWSSEQSRGRLKQ